jgi:hypothetical protein
MAKTAQNDHYKRASVQTPASTCYIIANPLTEPECAMNRERQAPRDFIAELGWGNVFNPSAVRTSPGAPSGTIRNADGSAQDIANWSSNLPAVMDSPGWDPNT